MALEALRDVFIQAGQNYANRARQDELLAQERARQDELYTRQRGDTEKDMNRRRDEQIEAEGRAEARQIASEDREIANAIKRVIALGAAEASNVMRRAVYMSGRSEALDPSKMDEATVAALFPEALKKKAVQDATNAQSAETEARMSNLKRVQEYTDAQRAPAIASETSRYSKIESDLAAVTSKIEARSKSSGGDAKRIGEMYSNAVTEEANRITGGDRLKYVKENFPKAKGDVADIDILMNSTSYPLFLERMKIQVAAEKDKDPEIVSLLTEQQNLFALRKQNQEALAALNFDFSTLTPRAGAPAVTPVGGTQPVTPKDRVTPSPAALNAAMGKGGAQTNVETTTTTPTTPTEDPFLGLDGGDPGLDGGAKGAFFVPATTSAAAADPAAVPAADPAAESSGPGFFSRAGRFVSDNPGTVTAGAATALGSPGVVKGAADFLSGGMNTARRFASRAGDALKGARAAANATALRAVASNSAAFGGGARLAGMFPTAAAAGGAGFLVGTGLNTALPYGTDAVGLTNTKKSYGGRTPKVSEIIADAYLAMTAKEKPKTFGDEFVLKYRTIMSANIPEPQKAELRDALIAFRDQRVKEGFTYESPASSINAAAGIAETPAPAQPRGDALRSVMSPFVRPTSAPLPPMARPMGPSITRSPEEITSAPLPPMARPMGPSITRSPEEERINAFFAPAQDPLALVFSDKPMTFGESYAQRYEQIKNSYLSEEEKAQSLDALERTKDALIQQGLTEDSPDPVQPNRGSDYFERLRRIRDGGEAPVTTAAISPSPITRASETSARKGSDYFERLRRVRDGGPPTQ